MPWVKQKSAQEVASPISGFNRKVLFSLAVERGLWATDTLEADMLNDASSFVTNYTPTYEGGERGLPPVIQASVFASRTKILHSHAMIGVRFDTPNKVVTLREYWGTMLMREIALNSEHFPVNSTGYAIPLQLFGAYNTSEIAGNGDARIRTHSWTVGSAPGLPGYVTASEGWDPIASNYPTITPSGLLPVRFTAQWAQTSEESILHLDHFEMFE